MAKLNSLQQRLAHVLAGRKINPWGRAIGLSSATCSRLINGDVPGSDVLLRIARAENCSISWLQDGVGKPFLASHFSTATEFANDVNAAADDGADALFIIDSPIAPAVVFSNAHQVTPSTGKPYSYTALDIFSAPLTEPVANTIKQLTALFGAKAYHIAPAEALVQRVRNGFMGSYLLLGDGQVPGLLSGAAQAGVCRFHKPASQAGVNATLLRQAIIAADSAVKNNGLELTADEQANAYAAVYDYFLTDAGPRNGAAVLAVIKNSQL